MFTTKRYYTLGSINVAVRDSAGSGSLNYLLGDQLGSTTVSVNSSGGAPVVQRYLPYGAARSTTGGTAVTDRGWIGQTKDGSTGLQYLNARYYDPTIGRFTATDPLADLSRPGTLDAYGYALGNPVTLSDPSGLFTCPDAACVFGGGGFLNGTPAASGPTSEQQASIDQFVYGNSSGNPVMDAALRDGLVPPPPRNDPFGNAVTAGARFFFDYEQCEDVWSTGCGVQALGVAPVGKLTKFGKLGRLFRFSDEAAGAGRGLGRLRSVGDGVLESTAGLRYGPGSAQGHRLRHVMQHGAPDATGKATHSVFVGGRGEILSTVDEAWIARGAPISASAGRETFIVPMARTVGTDGQRHVKIVVEKGTSNVVTAHPSGPSG